MNRALGLDWCGTIGPGEEPPAPEMTMTSWRDLRRGLERTQDVLRREYEDRARRLRQIQHEINQILAEEIALVDVARLDSEPDELRELMFAAQQSREAHDVLQAWVATFDSHLSSQSYNTNTMMPTGSLTFSWREHLQPEVFNAIGRWVEATAADRDEVPFTVVDQHRGAQGQYVLLVRVEERTAQLRKVVDGQPTDSTDWVTLERALATATEFAYFDGGPDTRRDA